MAGARDEPVVANGRLTSFRGSPVIRGPLLPAAGNGSTNRSSGTTSPYKCVTARGSEKPLRPASPQWGTVGGSRLPEHASPTEALRWEVGASVVDTIHQCRREHVARDVPVSSCATPTAGPTAARSGRFAPGDVGGSSIVPHQLLMCRALFPLLPVPLDHIPRPSLRAFVLAVQTPRDPAGVDSRSGTSPPHPSDRIIAL